MFLYLSPRKRTLTDAGDEDGGRGEITKNILQIIFFYILFPWKGTLTDARGGDGEYEPGCCRPTNV